MRLTIFGALALCMTLASAPAAFADAALTPAAQQPAPPTSPPSPSLQAVRDQANRELIETSRIFLAENQLQLKIDQLRVRRAEQEDRHAIMTLYKQSVTDVLIFILVMTLSTGGVYMSYLQFKKTVIDVAGPLDAEGKPLAPIDASSFKFGLAGVEMSSSIIGLLVLGLSLAFFYLYLDRVYEIRVLPTAPTAAAQTKP
jgi:hypothetical protein